jgi:PHP family Zn ribbon phosphoesterase
MAALFDTGLGEVAEAGKALSKGIEIVSSIGEDSKLVKYAEEAGKSVQKGLDSRTKELSKGNTNPGLGTKSLGNGISYARARDGARVFFQQAGNQIEILAKASKANESSVINYLKSIF